MFIFGNIFPVQITSASATTYTHERELATAILKSVYYKR